MCIENPQKEDMQMTNDLMGKYPFTGNQRHAIFQMIHCYFLPNFCFHPFFMRVVNADDNVMKRYSETLLQEVKTIWQGLNWSLTFNPQIPPGRSL